MAELKRLRNDLSYTQKEFAKHIGYSQSAIFQIETGKRPISMKMLEVIAEKLDGHLEISIVLNEKRYQIKNRPAS